MEIQLEGALNWEEGLLLRFLYSQLLIWTDYEGLIEEECLECGKGKSNEMLMIFKGCWSFS